MSIEYIYHSGFLIETDKALLLFDYWKDESNRVAQRLIGSQKAIYVFASHSHPDHFNAEILAWAEQNAHIQYVLSSDILEDKPKYFETSKRIQFLKPYAQFTDTLLQVDTFGSTDKGVSFVVTIDGKSIFHAGDLNNWHWRDESTVEEIAVANTAYIRELSHLQQHFPKLDVAMFPVDGRMGNEFELGATQFIKAIRTKLFVPMHFGTHYECTQKAALVATEHQTAFWSIANKNEIYKLPT